MERVGLSPHAFLLVVTNELATFLLNSRRARIFRRSHYMAGNDYCFLTIWRANASIREVYPALMDVQGYLRWWSQVYLAVEKIQEGDPLHVGAVHRLLTQGKLPYRLRWQARVIAARPPDGFSIEARGDFVGQGIWTLKQEGKEAVISFDWRLRAEKPVLKYLSFLMKPLFSWNHRWAMARGQEGLIIELERRSGGFSQG